MLTPARVDLMVDRHVPLALTISIPLDLAGGIWRSQIRLTAEAPGAPLVDLGVVTDASDGIRLLTGGNPSILQMQISEETLAALPLSALGVDRNVALAWDLLITPLGGLEARWFFGAFTLRAGTTR